MCTRTVSCRVSPCSRAVLQCQHHSKTFVKMCAGGVRITGDFQHKNKTRRVVEQDVHNDSSDVSCYCYCVYVCVCVCTSVGRERERERRARAHTHAHTRTPTHTRAHTHARTHTNPPFLNNIRCHIPAPRQSTNVFTETAMNRVTPVSSSPAMISSKPITKAVP